MLRNIPNRIDQVGPTIYAEDLMLTVVGNVEVYP
jgi:hypothetical protein